MSQSKYKKEDFINFIMATVENDSSDEEKAREYLSSQNLDVDAIVDNGIKRLKRLQLQIQAEQTKLEMQSAELAKQKATEWVDDLINRVDFSFSNVVEEEQLTLSFRNIEKLSEKDIKELLIKHFTLKFLDHKSKNKEDV